MKVTYICHGCGALIGSLYLTEAEQGQLGVDLLTAGGKEDIIKSATGDVFMYSLCEFCVNNAMALPPPDSQ